MARLPSSKRNPRPHFSGARPDPRREGGGMQDADRERLAERARRHAERRQRREAGS